MCRLHVQEKKIALVTPAGLGKTLTVNLDEYKTGGKGCTWDCPKVLGHHCSHMQVVAERGGHDIELFYPHHKTTAYWQDEMRKGGRYPPPPDEETIMQHAKEFKKMARMPLWFKAHGGRVKRRKSSKGISMARRAAKAR